MVAENIDLKKEIYIFGVGSNPPPPPKKKIEYNKLELGDYKNIVNFYI